MGNNNFTGVLGALAAGMVFLMAGGLASAQELDLTVNLENPVLLAGRAQVTWLKVGVRGFERTNQAQRPPINLALVLDRSGSMEGEKLDKAKEAALYAVDLLSARDYLSIIVYESGVEVLLPSTLVEDKREIRRLIREIHTGGSTALFAGVSRGARELRRHLSRDLVNRVVLLSDGLANVGPDTPGELGELGTSLRREGISVTTIGLGLDYNEDLMARLAQASDGNHAFVQEPRDLVRIFDLEFKDALSVVAKDLILRINCAPGIRPLRILGRDGEIRGQEVSLSLNQVYSQQEKYFLIEVEVPALSAGARRPVAQVTTDYANLITGKSARREASAAVVGTAIVQEQEKATVRDVAEAVAIQKNVEAGEEAIRLRDEGQVAEAQELLKKNAIELKVMAEELASPVLEASSAAAAKDAENIAKEEEWQSQRKSMRASQYSAENQQSY